MIQSLATTAKYYFTNWLNTVGPFRVSVSDLRLVDVS